MIYFIHTCNIVMKVSGSLRLNIESPDSPLESRDSQSSLMTTASDWTSALNGNKYIYQFFINDINRFIPIIFSESYIYT